MDATDSQLSLLIREGKMCDSQEPEGNITQELSQNTIQRIIDGQFTPLMSQASEEALTREISKSPTMRAVLHDILHAEKGEDDDSSSSTSSYFGPDRQTGLKRRTQRILDVPLLDQIEERTNNLRELNMSRDLFGDNEESNLLNESITSFATFSQYQCGSQTIEYLRDRTPEEQEQRNRRKTIEKLSRITEEAAMEQEAKDRMSELMTQRIEPIDYEMEDDSKLYNGIVKTEAKADVRPKSEEKFLMDVSVIEARASKKSDLAYKDFGENKILWTKPKCKVPVVVKWKAHSLDNNRDLSLRIRLVNYLKKPDMESAIRDPGADVLKCQNHIDEESRTPRESFFYIINSTVPWVCSVGNLNYPRGFEYSTKIKAGINEVNFDIMFMCQKNCMVIEDKRKTMCLAAFLEDESGSEISFSVIEEVHIHGYPQRDCKNFCGKLPTFHFPEKSSSFKPPMDITTTPGIDRQSAPSSSRHFTTYRPFDNTFSMTNSNRMLPSTSNSRKRVASEHVQIHDHTRLPSKSTEYIMKLYGCVPATEQMDYQIDPNENKNQPSTSAKRTRPSYFSQKTLELSQAEYRKVVEFLSEDALKTRNQWNASIKYPNLMTFNLEPNDSVERFLNLVGLAHLANQFRRRGMFSMADLAVGFNNNSSFFEGIVSDPSNLSKCYDLFLNYYRIQQNRELTKGNRN